MRRPGTIVLSLALPFAVSFVAWANDDKEEGPTPIDAAQDRALGDRRRSEEERRAAANREDDAARVDRNVRALGSLDADERVRALDELGSLGARTSLAEKAADAAVPGLESSNGYVVRYSVLALGRLRQARGAKALIELASSTKTTTPDRFYAIGALAEIRAPSAVPLFWACLDDPSPGIRRAAQVGLLQCLGPEVLPRLCDRLDEKAASARTRDACRDLLRRVRDESASSGARADPAGGASGGSDPRDDATFRAWARAAEERRLDPRPKAPELRTIAGAEASIETDVTDETRVRKIALELARFRRALAWFFDRRSGPAAEPVRVKLFANRRDFERYGATHDYNFQFFNEFYYSFLLREVVAFDLPQDEPLLLRRLRHELCHDYFERNVGMPPVWFNEGAAEVLEAARLDDRGKLVLERNAEWDPRLADVLREGGLPSLHELLSLTPERFYGEDAPRAYAAAWSFMDMLLRGKGEPGERLVRRIYEALRERRGADVPEIVESGALPGLEHEWHDRVKRDAGR